MKINRQMNVYSDEYFMRIALKQAQIAFENEEVPRCSKALGKY